MAHRARLFLLGAPKGRLHLRRQNVVVSRDAVRGTAQKSAQLRPISTSERDVFFQETGGSLDGYYCQESADVGLTLCGGAYVVLK